MGKPIEELVVGDEVQYTNIGEERMLTITAVDDDFVYCEELKFENSDGVQEGDKNGRIQSLKHEYLLAEEYYEQHNVGTKAGAWTCEHCGKTIPAGVPHANHKFYPEFSTYRTHHECTEGFIASLN
jgi:hypothetical protein